MWNCLFDGGGNHPVILNEQTYPNVKIKVDPLASKNFFQLLISAN